MIRYTKLNVGKINKANIKERSFVNNEGLTVTVKELELEIKDVREEKVLFEKNGKQMVKVGIITEKSFQDGTGQWQNGVVLGDVTEWREIKTQPPKEEPKMTSEGYNGEPAINVEDIPF